jgi:hypothetical protein
MSECFQVKFRFSGFIVLRKRFLDDLTLSLHFCDYLPIEEGMALYLKKFELSSPKDNLYQI